MLARGAVRYALAVLLAALLAALFAIVFRSALSAIFQAASGEHDVVSALERAPLWLRALLPAAGGLVAGLIGRMLERAPAGQGVGAVMEAVVLGRVQLSMPVTLGKSLASFAAIATGGSLGREGPLIQFGGAAGKLVSDRFELSAPATRSLIAAGTAAGFAAAYNTPLAAVLFVSEVVAGVMVLETLVPTLVATVVATLITRAVLGSGPIYGVHSFTLVSGTELLVYAGLGVVAALGAQGFMRVLALGERVFAPISLPFRPALGGLLAGLVIALMPEVAGNGYEPLNVVLRSGYAVPFLILLLLGKVFATTASVSSGSPGGVFTPSLLIGGVLGFLYQRAFAGPLGASLGPAESYALVGMAAVTAATTHAPLMAAVMVFELSGDYAIVLPLALATAIAAVTSRALRRESIYTAELSGRGVSWELTLEGRRLVRRSEQ